MEKDTLRIGRSEARGRHAIYCLTALRLATLAAGLAAGWLAVTHHGSWVELVLRLLFGLM